MPASGNDLLGKKHRQFVHCSDLLYRFIIQFGKLRYILLEGHSVKNIALYLLSKYSLLGQHWDQSTRLKVRFI